MESHWGMGTGLSSLPALQNLGISGGVPEPKRRGGGSASALPLPSKGDHGTGGALGQRIEQNLDRLLHRAEDLLQENRLQVLALAHALETHKTLSGEDVVAVLEGRAGPLVDGRPYGDPDFLRELETYHEAAVEAHRGHAPARPTAARRRSRPRASWPARSSVGAGAGAAGAVAARPAASARRRRAVPRQRSGGVSDRESTATGDLTRPRSVRVRPRTRRRSRPARRRRTSSARAAAAADAPCAGRGRRPAHGPGGPGDGARTPSMPTGAVVTAAAPWSPAGRSRRGRAWRRRPGSATPPGWSMSQAAVNVPGNATVAVPVALQRGRAGGGVQRPPRRTVPARRRRGRRPRTAPRSRRAGPARRRRSRTARWRPARRRCRPRRSRPRPARPAPWCPRAGRRCAGPRRAGPRRPGAGVARALHRATPQRGDRPSPPRKAVACA